MHFNLLSTNTKLEKSVAKFDVITCGLAMAPHRRSGFNVCENAGFCSTVCQMWFSGRTVTEPVRAAMIRRAKLLFTNLPEFERQLRADLDRITRRSERILTTAYVRLNVASDLDWTHIIEDYPSIRFYDYSKIKSRCRAMALGKLPSNYWITPSYNERTHNNSLQFYLRRGLNVSVVFDTAYHPQSGNIGRLPKTWRGHRVVDGDTHDLRHPDFDGRGVIVGLRFKGSRKLMSEGIKRGFVISA